MTEKNIVRNLVASVETANQGHQDGYAMMKAYLDSDSFDWATLYRTYMDLMPVDIENDHGDDLVAHNVEFYRAVKQLGPHHEGSFASLDTAVLGHPTHFTMGQAYDLSNFPDEMIPELVQATVDRIADKICALDTAPFDVDSTVEVLSGLFVDGAAVFTLSYEVFAGETRLVLETQDSDFNIVFSTRYRHSSGEPFTWDAAVYEWGKTYTALSSPYAALYDLRGTDFDRLFHQRPGYRDVIESNAVESF